MTVSRSELAVTVNWNGRRIKAIPLKQDPADGSWLMEALENGERWGVGDTIRVAKSEIESLPVAVVTEGIVTVAPRAAPPAPAAITRSRPMANSSLKEKLAQAATIGHEVTKIVGARADALIARKQTVLAHAERAFVPHESMMDAADQGLDMVDSALAVLTNGGPDGPLDGSTDSSSTT